MRPTLEGDRRHPALFLSAAGGELAPDVLSKMVSAFVSAGATTKKVSCHLFRHTAATLMLDADADVRHIAEMLGHQKLESTMTYNRVSMAKLREVHARVIRPSSPAVSRRHAEPSP